MQKTAKNVTPAPKRQGKAQNQSAGYPNLEALLDQDSPDLSQMLERQKELVDLSKSKTAGKNKIPAKHAALAYDKFFELFGSLLKVKQKMLKESQAKKPAAAGKAKK